MQDKLIANDLLSMVKSSLTNYANAIGETSNQQLRQTLQQIRNSDEQFQYQLANLAIQKGYYKTSQQASDNEITQVRQELSQG